MELDSIKAMEQRWKQMLKFQEDTWRLKSWATWIQAGDRNTNFFHVFAYQRRNSNAIWNIRGTDGSVKYSDVDIRREAVNFFGALLKERDVVNMQNLLWAMEEYPMMFDREANVNLNRHISVDGIHSVL